jgi:phosphoadenosine phosphosulfate reductase
MNYQASDPSIRAMEPPSATFDEAASLTAELDVLRAGRRLALLFERYGKRLAATTSFGLQSSVMLHLIKEHAPQIPVIFIDTGYHFPETYRYARNLAELLGVDLRYAQPAMTSARQEALYGRLWEQGKEGFDRYALINKIEPMNRALQELGSDVWISGLRRSQSSTRSSRAFAERQKSTLKVYPILDWADAQVSAYMAEHHLPPHPLASLGYVTMGDWHSTVPVDEGGDAESSRFNGTKYECGLHLDSGRGNFQI